MRCLVFCCYHHCPDSVYIMSSNGMLQWTKASHAQIRGSSLITSSCCSQFQFQLLIICSRFCLATQSVRQANQSQKPAEGELYGSLGKPGSGGGDKVRGDCGRVRPPEQRSWTAGRLLSCGDGPFCPERPAGSRAVAGEPEQRARACLTRTTETLTCAPCSIWAALV